MLFDGATGLAAHRCPCPRCQYLQTTEYACAYHSNHCSERCCARGKAEYSAWPPIRENVSCSGVGDAEIMRGFFDLYNPIFSH